MSAVPSGDWLLVMQDYYAEHLGMAPNLVAGLEEAGGNGDGDGYGYGWVSLEGAV